MLTGRTRLYVRATNDEWLDILENDLAASTGLRRFAQELATSEDLSPLVTPLLGAGYNPAPSAPIPVQKGTGAAWRTRTEDDPT
jgi:hypothetical protein